MRNVSKCVGRIVVMLAVLLTAASAPAFAGDELLYGGELDASLETVGEAQLECGGSGEDLTLKNAGKNTAALFFADGDVVFLSPGDTARISDVAVGTHKCVCKCTCSGEGFSQGFSFACPGSSSTAAISTTPTPAPADPCASSDGSGCIVNVNGDLKEGTASGCKRWYIPVDSSSLRRFNADTLKE